ncbi:MAG TPA: hypothetical protein VGT24_01735 [Candidatus Acidoferrales bacterium]|nr:hypothetical protein [Candidatus Acidoferrales bacterium]
MIHDPSRCRLGKQPARIDAKRLKLARYLPASLPPAPESCDWTGKVAQFGMMLNDREGDCVFAAGAHAIQTWSAAEGVRRTPPDDQIQSYYEGWAGYRPSISSTDQGYVIVEFLNRWRMFGYCGALLDGYADPDWTNTEHIKLSIALFGGVNLGLQLPLAWRDATVWDIERGPDGAAGSWGGHSSWCPAYNATGPICVTWGSLKQITWAGLTAYCDEAHVLRSPLFLNSQGLSASNVNFPLWDADLLLI